MISLKLPLRKLRAHYPELMSQVKVPKKNLKQIDKKARAKTIRMIRSKNKKILNIKPAIP